MSRAVTVGAVNEKPQKAAPILTRFDKLTSYAFTLFGRPALRFADSMPALRDNILKSNLQITPEGLISLAMFITLFSGIGIAIAVIIGLLYHFLFILIAPVALPLEFLLILQMPKFSQSGRMSALDTELPFVIGYISVLAGGGVSPEATLRRIARLPLFPAAAKEAKRILVQIDVFGLDPITAMEVIARQTPSRIFSEFLSGYTSVLKSGGDFITFTSIKLKDVFEAKKGVVKRAQDTTGSISEAYLTVTVILGMTLYTLYMVQTLIAGNNSGLQSLFVFAYLVVPLLSVAFIYLLDAVQPKWPYVYYRPYKIFAMCIPIGLVIFILPLPIPMFLHVAIALIAVALAPAVVSMRASRERRGLERALPDFIRDVAEGRKTGLSPERSLERLVGRRYGALSAHVKKMGSQLSWGVSLTTVITTFTSEVNSWLTKAIGTLLIEVVDVGGGTIRSFSEMADFTRSINDMENETRAALKSFVFIAYVAGIMVIMTTFIMVYFLGEPLSFGAPIKTALNGSTIDALLTTSIFDSFIIGIVAGKMGDSSVAEGFKHAIALVVISVVAVFVVGLFIKIPL